MILVLLSLPAHLWISASPTSVSDIWLLRQLHMTRQAVFFYLLYYLHISEWPSCCQIQKMNRKVQRNNQDRRKHKCAWRSLTFRDSLVGYFMTDLKHQIIPWVLVNCPNDRWFFALWQWFCNWSFFSSILLLRTLIKNTLLHPLKKKIYAGFLYHMSFNGTDIAREYTDELFSSAWFSVDNSMECS